jgi:hypothetical protein
MAYDKVSQAALLSERWFVEYETTQLTRHNASQDSNSRSSYQCDTYAC